MGFKQDNIFIKNNFLYNAVLSTIFLSERYAKSISALIEWESRSNNDEEI